MKKIWILICLIMVLITVYEITESYAKYTTSASGTIGKQVGDWVIHVNNSDISSGSSTHTFNIGNFNFLANSYVAPGKLAPDSEGYFDIAIDPSGTSVAIRFDATLDFSELELSDNINFDYACRVVNGVEDTSAMVRTARNTYTGIISLNEVKNNQVVTARFYIIWDGSDNAADMILGTSSEGITLNMPIEVTISQYMGESIVAYQNN